MHFDLAWSCYTEAFARISIHVSYIAAVGAFWVRFKGVFPHEWRIMRYKAFVL